MSTRSLLRRAATTTAIGVAGVALASGTAFAGSSGQQLEFHDNKHIANSIYVRGHNQDDVIVEHCFNTPNTVNQIHGWWWQGQISITAYSGKNCTGKVNWSAGPAVPAIQDGDDWTAIGD